MKNKHIFFSIIAIFVIIIFTCPNTTIAQGGSPGEFLRFGVGAAPLGMGMAYTAVSNDATSIFWNPARLTLLRQSGLHFSGSLTSLYGFASYNYFGFVIPLGQIKSLFQSERSLNRELEKWAFGFGFLKHGIDGIDSRDKYGFSGDSFDFDQNALYLSAARQERLGSFLFSIGGNLKFVESSVIEEKSNVHSWDFGADLFWDGYVPITISLVSRDLNQPDLGFNKSYPDIVPNTIRLGTSFILPENSPKELKAMRFAVDYDFETTDRGVNRWHFGIEWKPSFIERFGWRPLTLRAGYEPNRGNFTFGFGFDGSILAVGKKPFNYLPRLDLGRASGPESSVGSINSYLSWDFRLPLITSKEYYDRGMLEFGKKQSDWGARWFEWATDIFDTPPGGYRRAARLRLGDIEFLKTVDKASNCNNTIKHYKTAEEDVKQGREIDKNLNRNSFSYFIQSLILCKEYNKAIETSKRTLIWDHTPIQDADIRYLRAYALNLKGQTSSAKTILMQQPYHPYTKLLLGKIYTKEGKTTEALEQYEALVQMPSYIPQQLHIPLFVDGNLQDDVYLAVGQIYMQKGETNKAINAFGNLIVRFPFSDSANAAWRSIIEIQNK